MTRINIPQLGVDQIISPRSGEQVDAAADSPSNVPDVGEELVHLLAEGHTELDPDGSFLGLDLAEDAADEDLDLPLGADPDTALLPSVFLHLLSEHERLDALHLNEEQALVLHESLHSQEAAEGIETHWRGDLRFRHKRAMAAAMRCAEMDSEADQAVIAPANA